MDQPDGTERSLLAFAGCGIGMGMSGILCVHSCSELCLDDSFSVDDISSLANECVP